MNVPLRVAVVLAAAGTVYGLKAEWANAASDALLAATAGFIAWRYLNGIQKERLARLPENASRRSDLEEEARNIYARNSLQHPRLLAIALFGCAMKLFAVIAMVPAVRHFLWDA